MFIIPLVVHEIVKNITRILSIPLSYKGISLPWIVGEIFIWVALHRLEVYLESQFGYKSEALLALQKATMASHTQESLQWVIKCLAVACIELT